MNSPIVSAALRQKPIKPFARVPGNRFNPFVRNYRCGYCRLAFGKNNPNGFPIGLLRVVPVVPILPTPSVSRGSASDSWRGKRAMWRSSRSANGQPIVGDTARSEKTSHCEPFVDQHSLSGVSPAQFHRAKMWFSEKKQSFGIREDETYRIDRGRRTRLSPLLDWAHGIPASASLIVRRTSYFEQRIWYLIWSQCQFRVAEGRRVSGDRFGQFPRERIVLRFREAHDGPREEMRESLARVPRK